MCRSPASLARRAATAFVVLLALSASTTVVSAARQPDALSVKPARQLNAITTLPLNVNGGLVGTLIAEVGSVVDGVVNLVLNIVAGTNGLPAGTVLTVDLSLEGADVLSVAVANPLEVTVTLLGSPLLDIPVGTVVRQLEVTLNNALAPAQSLSIPTIVTLTPVGAVVNVVLSVVNVVVTLLGGLLNGVGGLVGGILG